MRQLPFHALLLCLWCFFCMPCTSWAVEPAALTITLDTSRNSLLGEAQLTLAPTPDGLLPPLYLAEDAAISRLTLNGKPVPYAFEGGLLRLGAVPAGTSQVTLELAYSCVFADPFPREPYAMDNPGFGVAATITENGAFLLPGSGWYPRPVTGDLSWALTVRAPASPLPVWAVTSGTIVSHTVEEDLAVSRYLTDGLREGIRGLTLMAGPYTLTSHTVPSLGGGEITLLTAFTAAAAHLAERYLEATARHIRSYETLHGPYAFSSFSVVENFFPTGYGMPGMTVLGRRVLALPFIPETSLRHEIAHCWWGNGVLVDYSSGNWCEGLTSYMADHWKEQEESAEAARDYRLRSLRRFIQVGAQRANLALTDFTSRTSPETQAIGYGKALFVFHMARKLLGDEAFLAALADVYKNRLFKETRWEDFRRAFVRHGMDEATSKRFMSQWTTRKDAPRLALADVRLQREASGYLVSGVLTQASDGLPYEASILLECLTESGPARTTLPVRDARTAFSLKTSARPTRLLADPEADLFRLLAPGEIPPSVDGLKGAERLTVVLSKNLDESYTTLAAHLAASLSQPHAAILRETELPPAPLDAALLFLGYPETEAARALLPKLPENVQVGPASLSLPGLASEPDTAFLALADAAGSPLGLLWLAPSSSQDHQIRAALKLTHYGRYAYLAFQAGENIAKGELPPPASPLAGDLTELLP